MMRLVAGWAGSAGTLSDMVWSQTLKTDSCLPDDTPTVFNIHSPVLTTFSQSVFSLPAGLAGPTCTLSCGNAVRS